MNTDEMFDGVVQRLIAELIAQGRTDEQIYGVQNFFSGKGLELH